MIKLIECAHCHDEIEVEIELPPGVEIDDFSADLYCASCCRKADESEAKAQYQQDFSDSLAAHACGFAF